MRTIKRKLATSANAKTRAALIAALCNRRIKAGARESTEQAIKLADSPESASHIRTN
jgi:hypothetical protein